MTEFSNDALFFLNTHQTMRSLNRAGFEKTNQTLLSAYRAAINVVASQANRSDGRYAELSEKAKRRGPLLAAFTVGLSLIEDALFEGYAIQAAALVRQEFEAIAALIEIENNKRFNKKTPNINVLNAHGRIYGFLSQIAHVADDEWLRRMVSYDTAPNLGDLPIDSTEAWSISPKYSEHLSPLLGIHVFLILHFTEHQALQMKDLHGLLESQEEESSADESLKILVDAGIVQIVAQPIVRADAPKAARLST